MMKLPDDDGGVFKPTSERLANELYEEMLTIVAALASNPKVINLDDDLSLDFQAEALVQMAHGIAVQSKTMHLSMLEAARERANSFKEKNLDDLIHEEEDKVAAI